MEEKPSCPNRGVYAGVDRKCHFLACFSLLFLSSSFFLSLFLLTHSHIRLTLFALPYAVILIGVAALLTLPLVSCLYCNVPEAGDKKRHGCAVCFEPSFLIRVVHGGQLVATDCNATVTAAEMATVALAVLVIAEKMSSPSRVLALSCFVKKCLACYLLHVLASTMTCL